jgi:hypothetical protein
MNKIFKRVGAALALLSASGVVLATPGPYDAITDAVDWSDVTTGLGVVAAALAGVFIFKRGAKMLLGMIGR